MKQLLDTNQLITYWQRRQRTDVVHVPDPDIAAAWGRDLIASTGTDAIVSPVYLEFVGAARSGEELGAYRAFLDSFTVLDGWDIRPADLRRAKSLAERVPRRHRTDPVRPRGAIDCLIRALAARHGHTVLSDDAGFPR